MTGEVKTTLTKEWVSSQAGVRPGEGRRERGEVIVLSRLPGLTAAKGS